MSQRVPDTLDQRADKQRSQRIRGPLVLLVGILVAVMIGFGVRIGNANPDQSTASTPSVDQSPLVVGAVPYWDEQEARASLETHGHQIGVASPWSYAVAADGSVQLQPELHAAGEQALAGHLHDLGIKVIPTVANTTAGLWDPATVSTVIKDPTLRRVHVQSIISLIQLNGFDGIQIDYEDLTADDRSSFSVFVGELGQAIHEIGKVLYVTVHVKEDDAGYDARNKSQDYAAIGKAADQVCLMAYDWHWSTSPSGAIAPYDWVERVIRYSVTRIPANKLLLGVGLFGYDWVGTTATNLTWRQVVTLAAQNRVDEAWDVGAQSPHFSYSIDGVQHDVWYENGRSAAAKFDLAKQYRLAGVELWRLGGEDPAVWAPGP